MRHTLRSLESYTRGASEASLAVAGVRRGDCEGARGAARRGVARVLVGVAGGDNRDDARVEGGVDGVVEGGGNAAGEGDPAAEGRGADQKAKTPHEV